MLWFPFNKNVFQMWKHTKQTGLSIGLLPFSYLCFDSSLLVSFLPFRYFWIGCVLRDGENNFFFFGFSNIQNILTLRQFPSQIRRKSGGEPQNDLFFFCFLISLFLQQKVTLNNPEVLFLLAYLLRFWKCMRCQETRREGSSGWGDAIF